MSSSVVIDAQTAVQSSPVRQGAKPVGRSLRLVLSFLLFGLALALMTVLSPQLINLFGIDGLTAAVSPFLSPETILAVASTAVVLPLFVLVVWRLEAGRHVHSAGAGCPQCRHRDFVRVTRRGWERKASSLVLLPTARYVCRGCSWEGLLVYRERQMSAVAKTVSAIKESNDNEEPREVKPNDNQSAADLRWIDIGPSARPAPLWSSKEATEATIPPLRPRSANGQVHQPAETAGKKPDLDRQSPVAANGASGDTSEEMRGEVTPAPVETQGEASGPAVAGEQESGGSDGKQHKEAASEEANGKLGPCSKPKTAEYGSLPGEQAKPTFAEVEPRSNSQSKQKKNAQPARSPVHSTGAGSPDRSAVIDPSKPLAVVVFPFGLKLRKQPRPNAEVLAVLPTDTVVQLLEDPGNREVSAWQQVFTGETTGWVSCASIRRLPSGRML